MKTRDRQAITRTTALRLAKDATPFSVVYAQPRP